MSWRFTTSPTQFGMRSSARVGRVSRIEVVAAAGPLSVKGGSDPSAAQPASRTAIAAATKKHLPVVRGAGMGSGYGRPVP